MQAGLFVGMRSYLQESVNCLSISQYLKYEKKSAQSLMNWRSILEAGGKKMEWKNIIKTTEETDRAKNL